MKFIMMLIMSLMLVGCGLPQKSWGTAGSFDAFKFTVTEGQSGSFTPELNAGGGAYTMAFQKAYEEGQNYPTMFTYSRRKSMWGMFSGDVSAGNVSCVYIAGSKETPEQTEKILERLAILVNDYRIADKKDE